MQEFADWVAGADIPSITGHLPVGLPGVQRVGGPTESDIHRIALEWSNTIQLTTPQPSLEDPNILLDKLAQSHLREPTHSRRREFRDKQELARLAINSVRQAVARQVGATEAHRLVHSDYLVGGRVIPNVKVDMAITSNMIQAVSQALSFETHDMSELERHMQHALYTLKDIAEARDTIRRDVVAQPPLVGQRNYRQALQRFQSLPAMCKQVGAEVILGTDMAGWTDDLATLALRGANEGGLHARYA